MNTRICKNCASQAINPKSHGRESGADLDLCDVCYWRKRSEEVFGYLLTALNCQLTLTKQECVNMRTKWNSQADKAFFHGRVKGLEEAIETIKNLKGLAIDWQIDKLKQIKKGV